MRRKRHAITQPTRTNTIVVLIESLAAVLVRVT